jgi:diketogulonate reductase-like aldo/keto reductase
MHDHKTLTARGVTVPRLGFGTWQITGEPCVDAVRNALDIGYRHIDTARSYGNEAEVGRGIAESGLAREDIFVTTKVWMDDLAPGRLRASAEASLNDLNLDHVDLLLMDIAANHDLFLTAYSPLAHGKVVEDPKLQEIGETHGKSAGQVALRWLLDQPRVATIPKAASAQRRAENLDVWDFELSDREHRAIARLPKDRREFDPAWAPDWAA